MRAKISGRCSCFRIPVASSHNTRKPQSRKTAGIVPPRHFSENENLPFARTFDKSCHARLSFASLRCIRIFPNRDCDGYNIYGNRDIHYTYIYISNRGDKSAIEFRCSDDAIIAIVAIVAHNCTTRIGSSMTVILIALRSMMGSQIRQPTRLKVKSSLFMQLFLFASSPLIYFSSVRASVRPCEFALRRVYLYSSRRVTNAISPTNFVPVPAWCTNYASIRSSI